MLKKGSPSFGLRAVVSYAGSNLEHVLPCPKMRMPYAMHGSFFYR